MECTKRALKDICCCHWPCCHNADDENSFTDNESLEEQKFITTPLPTRPTKSSSEVSYTQIGPLKEETEEMPLSQSVADPDEEYIKNFENLGSYRRLGDIKPGAINPDNIETLLSEAESILSSVSLTESTPREIVTRAFNSYSLSIRLTADLDKKAHYIHCYEERKNEFDQDNIEEMDKAQFYLENARNLRTPTKDRIEYYQTAIKFTNNLTLKEEIRTEYRDYYFSECKKKL
jgi:hypothetical protein